MGTILTRQKMESVPVYWVQGTTGKAHSAFQIFNKNKETRHCLQMNVETKKNVWSGRMDNHTDQKNTALGLGTVTFWGPKVSVYLVQSF